MLAEADAMEILTRVEQYYQNAYGNLVTIMSLILVVGLAIVGVVIPLILEWLRSRSFQRGKDEILREVSKVRETIESEVEMAKRNAQRLFDQSVRRLNHHTAVHWYEMAEAIHQTTGEAWPLAMKYWCFSINGALDACWEPSHVDWPRVVNCLGKFTSSEPAKDLAQAPELRKYIEQGIGRLEKMPKTKPYSTLLAKLERLLEPKQEAGQ